MQQRAIGGAGRGCAADRPLRGGWRLKNGGGLAVARFAFDHFDPRAQYDGGRIISRLMRRMDFGTHEDNGSVVVVFAETDLRSAMRSCGGCRAVMRHTSHGKRNARMETAVTVAAL